MSAYSTSSDVIDSSQEIDFTGRYIHKNKYGIIKKLGHGTFSTVWLAYDRENRNFCAIKIQHDDSYVEGEEEVATLRKILKTRDPNLMMLRDSFEFKDDDGGEHICMVFELMAGSVYDIIRHGKYKNGMPTEMAISILKQVLQGMHTLQNSLGVVHCDIKPENILVEGVASDVQDIIDRFNKLNYNKIKSSVVKHMRKHKTGLQSVEERTLQEMLKKLNIDLPAEEESDEEDADSDSTRTDEAIESSTDEDTDSDSEDEQECKIPDKYLTNCKVRISDYGGTQSRDSLTNFDIQTRYYQAPEMLLRFPFTETCDMWSIGCIVYELLTGKILFDPVKSSALNRDRHHLYDMQRMLGPIPDSLTKQSKRKKLFFRQDGTMKGVFEYKYEPLQDLLKSDIGPVAARDFIHECLQFDCSKRLTTKNALGHPFLTLKVYANTRRNDAKE